VNAGKTKAILRPLEWGETILLLFGWQPRHFVDAGFSPGLQPDDKGSTVSNNTRIFPETLPNRWFLLVTLILLPPARSFVGTIAAIASRS